ncbi:uncharacterized protein A4U43_C08F4680 [Asparagus officinalis]|nr:uncharacterized protein A4U43_C08F4680 [Asparagus officinalis]
MNADHWMPINLGSCLHINRGSDFTYKEEDRFELEDSAPVNSISMQLPQQLYQASQFAGCESEVIEFGLSAFNNIYMQMDMDQLSEELDEFFPSEQCSSPSSSQQSLSIKSQEQTSLLKNASTCSVPDTQRTQTNTYFIQPCLSSIQAYDQFQDIKYPTMKNEDMIITRALSAIFSSNSNSSLTCSILDQSLRRDKTNRSLVTCFSDFKPYNSAIPLMTESKKRSCGQKMIKDSITYLRKINLMREEAADEELRPSSHRLQHTLSERKRREKLNGSFYSLRLLLPPSSKKDKASVLYRTKDYLKTLEAQIFELEKKNQMLETLLLPTDETEADVNTNRSLCSKHVQITEAFEPITGIRRMNLKITVNLECDLLKLILHALEYLKETGVVSLVEIDANTNLQQMVQFTLVTLKFDIKESDWDEVSFKKGMTKAVDNAIMSPQYLAGNETLSKA